MAIQLTINGQTIPVKSLEYTINKTPDGDEPAFDLSSLPVVEQTFTLKTDYYRAMHLAKLLDKHSPKKAKQIRKRFEHINPLRKMGLL